MTINNNTNNYFIENRNLPQANANHDSKAADKPTSNAPSEHNKSISISPSASAALLLEKDFGIEVNGLSLSNSQINKLHSLFKELGEITGETKTVHLPEAKHKALEAIDQKIVAIYETTEGKTLNAQQTRELDELHQQANDILGIKPLTQEQQSRVDALHTEIDTIFSEDFDTQSLDDENHKLEKLFSELDSIRSNLQWDTATQQQADDIERAIERALESDDPSNQTDTLNALFDDLDSLYNNAPLSPSQQKQLHDVDQRIFDVLQQANGQNLSSAQEKQLTQLFEKADGLLGRSRFSTDESQRIEKLNAKIEGILEKNINASHETYSAKPK